MHVFFFSFSLLHLIMYFRLSPEQKLFEAVEESGVKGLNEEVLTTLIAMYLKKGIARENPSPYLAPYKVFWTFFLSFVFVRDISRDD